MWCYKMSLGCHKGVKGQVHKDLPIGLKINGNDHFDPLEMLNIFLIDSMTLRGHKEVRCQILKTVPIELKLINNDPYVILSI